MKIKLFLILVSPSASVENNGRGSGLQLWWAQAGGWLLQPGAAPTPLHVLRVRSEVLRGRTSACSGALTQHLVDVPQRDAFRPLVGIDPSVNMSCVRVSAADAVLQQQSGLAPSNSPSSSSSSSNPLPSLLMCKQTPWGHGSGFLRYEARLFYEMSDLMNGRSQLCLFDLRVPHTDL